jgi:protein-disulfide isomerase
MYNKPGGKKLAQYEVNQAFAEGEEFDYQGRATDQIYLSPQSQSVTFTGRTGVTGSPVIGSFTFPAQQGSALNSFSESPGSVTQQGLSVEAYMYFPTGPFDAKIFQAAEANTPISPVSIFLSRHGTFKGKLNKVTVFEFNESATSDGVQSFLSLNATAGG